MRPLISIDTLALIVWTARGCRAASAIILFILCILAILLQTITIKVLTDLAILFPEDSIDMQVLTDLEFILCILCILAILLQTLRRTTTPRI